jgi:hypothetical protein
MATSLASASPSMSRSRGARVVGRRSRAASKPSLTKRRRIRATVSSETSKAAATYAQAACQEKINLERMTRERAVTSGKFLGPGGLLATACRAFRAGRAFRTPLLAGAPLPKR